MPLITIPFVAKSMVPLGTEFGRLITAKVTRNKSVKVVYYPFQWA